jgi:hypothetical protein
MPWRAVPTLHTSSRPSPGESGPQLEIAAAQGSRRFPSPPLPRPPTATPHCPRRSTPHTQISTRSPQRFASPILPILFFLLPPTILLAVADLLPPQLPPASRLPPPSAVSSLASPAPASFREHQSQRPCPYRSANHWFLDSPCPSTSHQPLTPAEHNVLLQHPSPQHWPAQHPPAPPIREPSTS